MGETSSGAARHFPLKGKAENPTPMPPGLYNMDCMEAMKQFPDKFFDLAVVDPPYGDAGLTENSIGGGARFGGIFDRYKTVEPLRTTLRPVQELPEFTGGGGMARTNIIWASPNRRHLG